MQPDCKMQINPHRIDRINRDINQTPPVNKRTFERRHHRFKTSPGKFLYGFKWANTIIKQRLKTVETKECQVVSLQQFCEFFTYSTQSHRLLQSFCRRHPLSAMKLLPLVLSIMITTPPPKFVYAPASARLAFDSPSSRNWAYAIPAESSNL